LRLRALSDSLAKFLGDVLGLGVRSDEPSVFLLLVGALMWAAAQLGAFALFRRHRPGPAITLAVTALLINMSITVQEQLPHLIVLVAAALLLVVRTSLFAQLEQWRVRRIADSGYASQLFLRSGATFVAVALVSSLVLAANASSAPLRPMWDDALERMIEVGIEINHVIGGVNGPARGPNLLFTPTQTIRDQWETSNERVFTAINDDGRAHNWRGSIYDYFDGRSWQHVTATNVAVPAFEDLDSATSDAGLSVGRHELRSEITSVALAGSVIVAPADPVRLDHDATVQLTSDGGLVDIRLSQSIGRDSSYLVTSRVLDSSGPNELTETQLSTAGLDYGPAPKRYTDVVEGSIGPLTEATADNIVNALDFRDRDPYHVADAIRRYFRTTGGFQYDTDVRGMCTGENLIDCFLQKKRGYCEYFATSMVMMLRTQQIPSRYVVGYLPGRSEQVAGFDEDNQPTTITQRVVERSASHAWVEVYFPGYGWVPFDPTPGLEDQGQDNGARPTGAPTASRRPDGPQRTPNFEPTFGEGGGIKQPPNIPPPATGTQSILALVLGVLVLVAAFVVVLIASRRRRLIPGAQVTYDSVARMASRLGYGPLPSQTAYEYASRLSVVVPAVREELQMVATAKVEALYGKRQPSEELRQRLLRAYRRVRLSLLRLLLRRRPRMSVPRVRFARRKTDS